MAVGSQEMVTRGVGGRLRAARDAKGSIWMLDGRNATAPPFIGTPFASPSLPSPWQPPAYVPAPHSYSQAADE